MKSVSAVVLGLAFAVSSHAEDVPVYAGEDVVVTATRFETTPENTSVSVKVISAEDIKKSTAKTIPALLAQHAGIQVRSTDGTPDMAIDLRGFGMAGNQNTLVLLDGQRLNDIELTSIRWSAIPLDSIERIEIVNGSGAVLYGAGATGGTINIITKSPGKGMVGTVSIGLGSYDSKEWQVSLGGKGERLGIHVAASGLDSSNYRTNNEVAQNNLEADVRTDIGRGEAILKFGADKQNLRYPGVRRVNPALGLDQLASDRRGTATPLDYGKRDGGHVSVGASQQLDFGGLAVELAYRDKKQQAYFDAFGGSYLDTNLNVVSLTPRLKVLHRFGDISNELTVGVDLADWDYESHRSNSPATIASPTTLLFAKQSNRALYAQNSSELSADTQLTLGLRAQRSDYQARDAVNPAAYAASNQGRSVNVYELGLRHNLKPGWTLFGRIGRSFRIATVDEIFDQYGGPLFDSKIIMLEPQTSQDREVGLDFNSGASRARLALYHMDLNNEIHYNAITFTNMNLSPTRRYGLELEGMHAYNDALELSAAYSYTAAQFREGVYGGNSVAGNDIPLVPKHRLILAGAWKLSAQTAINGSTAYVGEQRFDNDQANVFAMRMPAYTTVDVKLSHHTGAWSLSAAVNNLFNEKYFTYAVASTTTQGVYNAYPMPERNFSLVAAYEFK